MRILPIISSGICVLIAFYMPSNVARPVEVTTVAAKPVSQIKALQATEHPEAKQLQSVVVEAPKQAPVAPEVPKVAALPSNSAKAFIYAHESGNNPAAVNSIGCRGLGQACPGSKLPCGNDYACQDAWFTNYAMERYGSWEAAYSFWLGHSWW